MSNTTPSSSSISRRSLSRGAAWAVPAITVAAASPAIAASTTTPPALGVAGRVTYNASWNTENPDGTNSYKVFSTIPGTTTPGAGYRVTNTTTSTTITNYTVTYYLPTSSLSFSTGPSSNAGWSLLSRDTTKASKTYNGYTYYAYTTRYTPAITAVNGTTTLPIFEFQSQSGTSNPTALYYVDNSAVINGTTQIANYGPISEN